MAGMPVFIGGFRSGTTLLVNLLGMHEDVNAWFETKELCEVLRYMKVLSNPASRALEERLMRPALPVGFTPTAVHERMLHHVQQSFRRIQGERRSGKASHEHYPLGNDKLDYSQQEAESLLAAWLQELGNLPDYAQVRGATSQLLSGLVALQCRQTPGACCINKTPEISRFACQLRDTSGRCKIIYLVRDGLDVVASALKLGWGDAAKLAFLWEGLLRETRKAMQDHESDYLELRYENLLQNPESVLRSVMQFCGLQDSTDDIVANFRALYGEHAFRREAGRGREKLSGEERAAFASVAGDMQGSLGYTLD